MCIATKNFESESKFKSNRVSNRVPKRVPISHLDNNNCSFDDRSNGSCVKRYNPYKECD